MSQIEEFSVLLIELQRIRERKWKLGNAMTAYWKRQAELIWAKYFKKKKFSWTKLIEVPEYIELKDKIEGRKLGRRFHDNWEKKTDIVKTKLNTLANQLEIEKADDFVLYDRVNSGMYSSQGFGEVAYARSHANSIADFTRAYDVETDVRQLNDSTSKSCGHTMHHCDFEIWVKTTELCKEILKRKLPLSLVEVVRNSLKRGANPRVNYPFLPYSFESDCGIDNFGNIVDQEKYSKAAK